jgi:hypothetical protein
MDYDEIKLQLEQQLIKAVEVEAIEEQETGWYYDSFLRLTTSFLGKHLFLLIDYPPGPLDFWSGLAGFNDIIKSLPLTDHHRFRSHMGRILSMFSIMTGFKEDLDLRRAPGFIVFPFDDGTKIMGIVFKVDTNGQTFVLLPGDMIHFWQKLYGEKFNIVGEIRRSR